MDSVNYQSEHPTVTHRSVSVVAVLAIFLKPCLISYINIFTVSYQQLTMEF